MVTRWRKWLADPKSTAGAGRAGIAASIGGLCEIFDIENEGESHDVVENKGSSFLTHDVDDK
jgi:hypothetical protein